MIRKKRRRTISNGDRKGGAVVEAALILPVLIVLTLGVIDISQYICLAQVVCNASRECAREASRSETTSTSDVKSAAATYFADLYQHLSSSEIEEAMTLTIQDANGNTVTDLSSVASGSELTAFITFDFEKVRWLEGIDYWTGSADQATCVFRRE